MKTVCAFDFDGTLTDRDSLLLFIRFVKGTKGFLLTFARRLPQLVLMKLGMRDNGKVKEQIFGDCFAGMSLDDFNALCRRFEECHHDLLRPAGVNTVEEALRQGHHVAIVSASIDNWVQPFFPNVQVIGTQLEVRNGRLTGRFLTSNCYGAEKVRRLLEMFPDRKDYRLVAYGDSRGDQELLDFADEAHYKPFRL